jgi:hypothetical protein
METVFLTPDVFGPMKHIEKECINFKFQIMCSICPNMTVPLPKINEKMNNCGGIR